MSGAKQEYPPILLPGLQEMSLAELRTLCVERFPLSQNREHLMRSVEAICTSLSTALVLAEVWVDGSFLTEKIEPDDVDLVVKLSFSTITGASDEQLALFDRISKRKFGEKFPCESYIFTDYPEGHKLFGVGDLMNAYWKRQFGFSRATSLKGIALIRTPMK